MTNVFPISIEGNTIYVEVETPYGSEDTTSLNEVLEGTKDAFELARIAILGVAKNLFSAINTLDQSITPDEFGLEFGIKFSAEGNVILAKTGTEANLKVSMLYKHGKEREDA